MISMTPATPASGLRISWASSAASSPRAARCSARDIWALCSRSICLRLSRNCCTMWLKSRPRSPTSSLRLEKPTVTSGSPSPSRDYLVPKFHQGKPQTIAIVGWGKSLVSVLVQQNHGRQYVHSRMFQLLVPIMYIWQSCRTILITIAHSLRFIESEPREMFPHTLAPLEIPRSEAYATARPSGGTNIQY